MEHPVVALEIGRVIDVEQPEKEFQG